MSFEEKIKALGEEIKATPHNKATEAHLARLKTKLARLKEQLDKTKSKKKAKHILTIKKSGDATVLIIGEPFERGSFLEKLVGVQGTVGMLIYKGAHIQFLNPDERLVAGLFSMAQLVIAIDKKVDFDTPTLAIRSEDFQDYTSINAMKERIFKSLQLIRVYLKKPGKKADISQPLIMKKGSNVRDICLSLHKKFLKDFKYAMVWGRSAKFQGQRVGLAHELEDEDILEIIFEK